jgi:predicted kinase
MWKLIDTYNWEEIKSEFRWIRDMTGIPQDPVFHAEGDVETHTSMVVKALLDLPEYKSLSEQDQHILFAAALFHDVEKRSTTVIEDDGRITSKGHAKKGEFTTRNILYKEILTPFHIREAVAKLVRLHGLPLWIFEKPDPVKAAIGASLEVNTQHLALLAQADVLGRYCEDQNDLLYKVELFRELCKDNDCYGKPRKFENGLSQYFYFHKEEAFPDFVPFDETKFEVIMMSALPGAGKDTYIDFNLSEMPVVSLDAIRRALKITPTDIAGNGRVIQMAKEKAKEFMRKKQSFIWNATNTTKSMREQLIYLFTSYGGRVKIIYIEVPYLTLLRQNRERKYPVPPVVLERLIQRLDIPTSLEAHEVEYIIREQGD